MLRFKSPSSTPQKKTRIPAKHKLLYCLRHGATEMNEYLERVPWAPVGWKDPMLIDTKLTAAGVAGARLVKEVAKGLNPKPEVVLVSPLSRAIDTAEIAFEELSCPREIEALLRERVYFSPDIGKSTEQLKQAYPQYEFSELPNIWWYHGKEKDAIEVEPEELHQQRVRDLKNALLARPETAIALVSHWGTLFELTGHEFENCELARYLLDPDGITHPVLGSTGNLLGDCKEVPGKTLQRSKTHNARSHTGNNT